MDFIIVKFLLIAPVPDFLVPFQFVTIRQMVEIISNTNMSTDVNAKHTNAQHTKHFTNQLHINLQTRMLVV